MRRAVRSGLHRAFLLMALATVTGFMAACGSPAPEVIITMSEFKYTPDKVTIGRNQKTIFKIENQGGTEHNLMIRQINVSTGLIAPGQTKILEIAAPRGPLKFVCLVPGHEDQGMVGEITVDASRR